MNSLQIGMIGIGVLLLALLALIFWWQNRQAARSSEPSEPRAPDSARARDPGLGQVSLESSPRIEPQLRSDGLSSAETHTHVQDDVVRLWRPELERQAETPSHSGQSGSSAGDLTPSPGFEAPPVVEATPATKPSTPRLVSELPFDQRLHVHASVVSLDGITFDAGPIVAAAGRARAWVRLFRQSPLDVYDPESVASVQQLVLALPLASRAGPLTQQDLDTWQYEVAEAVRKSQGEVQFHGLADAASRAVELDQFLAAVDITPIVYMVKKDETGWAGTRLRSTLEANGFRLQSDGRFAYHEIETDRVLFHAVDGFERPFTPERLRTETIRALRFSLQPVNLQQPLARFDTFRQSLRALAKLLDAELRSSEGTLIDEAAFAVLRNEVKLAVEALEQAGIEPGSDTARALFS